MLCAFLYSCLLLCYYKHLSNQKTIFFIFHIMYFKHTLLFELWNGNKTKWITEQMYYRTMQKCKPRVNLNQGKQSLFKYNVFCLEISWNFSLYIRFPESKLMAAEHPSVPQSSPFKHNSLWEVLGKSFVSLTSVPVCYFLTGSQPLPGSSPSWIQGIRSMDGEVREIYRYRERWGKNLQLRE